MDSKTRSAIIGSLRRVWGRHPDKLAALKRAEVREYPVTKSGAKALRPLVFYICSQCGGRAKSVGTAEYPAAHVDHIDPVIPLDGSTPSWDELVARMFTSPENLAVLCSTCHKIKTGIENQTRRDNKKRNGERLTNGLPSD